MECKHCGKEFEAKRSTAQYCSAKCRVVAKRNRAKDSVTDDTLSPAPDVTLRDDYVAHVSGVIGEAIDMLPALPDDTIITCNQDIGWPEILAMSRAQIDYVYQAWKAIGDDMLLRLRRAAGYYARTAA